MEIASAFVTVAPSARGFGRQLDSEVSGEVSKSGKGIGSKFGSALKVGAVAAVGGAVLAAGFVKGAIGEAREAQKVGALTNAVIKSTGGIANVTAKDVGTLSSAISKKIGVDDEAIQAGQNMLLTFGNVRNEVGKGNDVFNQATIAASDMAAAFGGDAVSNSKMLGKALNDPTKGVSALTRVGVSFTQQQKDQIKSMQESGNMLGAQKIILGEVSKQTKGAAAASATAGDKFKVAFGNLQEGVGTALLPALDAGLTGATKLTDFLTANLGPAFSKVSAFVTPFAAQFKSAFGGGGGAGLLAPVLALGVSLKVNLLPALQAVANTVMTTIVPAVISLATYVGTALVPIFLKIASIVTTQVIPIIGSLATFFYGTLYPAIFAIVTAVAQNLRPVFDQLVATFQAKVLPAVDKVLVKFRQWQPTIQKVVMVVVLIVGKLLILASAILGKVLPILIRLQVTIISKVVTAIIGLVRGVAKGVSAIIGFGRAFVNAIQPIIKFQRAVLDKVGVVISFMVKVPGKIIKAFGDPLGLLKTIGSQIIEGLKRGIEGAAHLVTDAVGAIVDKIPKKIRKIMGIASPSKVTKILGQYIADGLAQGVRAHGPKAVAAVNETLDQMRASLTKKRDAIKSVLDGLKSDFRSLRDSVASTFTSGMFDATATIADATSGVSAATVGENFISGLTGTVGNLGALKKAFKTLKGWGLSAKFLSQLFASGNSALILELAGDKALATQGAGLFSDANSLSTQLGTSVAGNQYGDKIDGTNKRLDKINERLKDLPANIGKQINKAGKAGARKGKKT